MNKAMTAAIIMVIGFSAGMGSATVIYGPAIELARAVDAMLKECEDGMKVEGVCFPATEEVEL